MDMHVVKTGLGAKIKTDPLAWTHPSVRPALRIVEDHSAKTEQDKQED